MTIPTAASFFTFSFSRKCDTPATKIGCDVTRMTDVDTSVRLRETIQSPKWNDSATPLRTMSPTSFLEKFLISDSPPVQTRYGRRIAHERASL